MDTHSYAAYNRVAFVLVFVAVAVTFVDEHIPLQALRKDWLVLLRVFPIQYHLNSYRRVDRPSNTYYPVQSADRVDTVVVVVVEDVGPYV